MAHGKSENFNENPLDILDWDEFDYLVPQVELSGAAAFLPTDTTTIEGLIALGKTMSEVAVDIDKDDSAISAVYTYLGQFIDHDITLTIPAAEGFDPNAEIGKPDFVPLSREKAKALLRNKRTGSFDLDSLYGLQPIPSEIELAVPFSGDKFDLGKVTNRGNRPANKADDNDLPRVATGTLAKRARIGDPRNDENVIVAQLHLAFLKFHNAVVSDGASFDAARKLVTHHYQWVVLQDFLPRICDPKIVRNVIENGNRLYKTDNKEKFMPFEFAVAAYRFGHSMVRDSYDFNVNFLKDGGAQAKGTLDLMFLFTGLSGNLGNEPTLPENWIIEWELMLRDRAKKIEPSLTSFLAKLPGVPQPVNVMEQLATRNLLKGYLFNLPTGQALAKILLRPCDRLSSADLKSASRPKLAGEEESQWSVLERFGFDEATPLWFYILAEAKVKGHGNRLGPLGSLLIAETIIGLMRANPDSILNQSFVPTLGVKAGQFDLQDLLIKAGVLAERIAT